MNRAMRSTAAIRALILAGLVLAVVPIEAQNVLRVSAEVQVSAQQARCEVQYFLKNGKQELAEVPLSGILYHGSGVGDLRARDGSGVLSVSGAASGDKFAGRVALRQPLAPEAEYSFTVSYDVPGGVQRKSDHWVLSAPILHAPWRSRLSKEPAMSIRGVLPEGTNFIWASPRYLTTGSEAGRVVVTTASPVLASYFRAEYTEGRVGFFTPRVTAIVSFFGGAAVLIAIWLIYVFGRKRGAKA